MIWRGGGGTGGKIRGSRSLSKPLAPTCTLSQLLDVRARARRGQTGERACVARLAESDTNPRSASEALRRSRCPRSPPAERRDGPSPARVYGDGPVVGLHEPVSDDQEDRRRAPEQAARRGPRHLRAVGRARVRWSGGVRVPLAHDDGEPSVHVNTPDQTIQASYATDKGAPRPNGIGGRRERGPEGQDGTARGVGSEQESSCLVRQTVKRNARDLLSDPRRNANEVAAVFGLEANVEIPLHDQAARARETERPGHSMTAKVRPWVAASEIRVSTKSPTNVWMR